MGAAWHPHLLRCDPAAARLEIDGLSVPAEAVRRLGARRGLLESLDGLAIAGSQGLLEAQRVRHEAFELLGAGATRRALEIERETEATRDRYGRTKFGQSVLLARRLVEAGVRLVQVNYPREPGDTTSNNPLWDTHVDNAGRLERVLCPTFDTALAALLDDLAERGLLDDTLVVAMGEFGRTPRINPSGGRDHWGSVFSVALAGAGLPGGAVIGASDAHGAQPTLRPVRPPDLAATIFQLLGIDPATEFRDGLGRPLALVTGGEPLAELVG
jgi:hypothetical protein